MSLKRRLDKLGSAPAREPMTAHTLSTRALEASWQALERRSFAARADVIDAVTLTLLARPDGDPAIRERAAARAGRHEA